MNKMLNAFLLFAKYGTAIAAWDMIEYSKKWD